MKQELQDKLISDFPILYGPNSNPLASFFRYGFEHNLGWEPLIRELSAKLEKFNHENPDNQIHCLQSKEKFGTLSFYADNFDDETSQYIAEAMTVSASTCEDCGAEGITGGQGWIRTLCVVCRKAHDNRPLNFVNNHDR